MKNHLEIVNFFLIFTLTTTISNGQSFQNIHFEATAREFCPAQDRLKSMLLL